MHNPIQKLVNLTKPFLWILIKKKKCYSKLKSLIQHTHTIQVRKYANTQVIRLDSIFSTHPQKSITIDKKKYYVHPLAMIKIPSDNIEYLNHIGSKSRNMLKKATKMTIRCRVFDWNNYLDDIYTINTSSLIRQGREMTKSYQEHPKKFEYNNIKNPETIHFGAFKNNRLIGYIELQLFGNIAVFNRILGHVDFLKYGIMNKLIAETVNYSTTNSNIEYINYLTMLNRDKNSLSAFKYRVGFREYAVELIQK